MRLTCQKSETGSALTRRLRSTATSLGSSDTNSSQGFCVIYSAMLSICTICNSTWPRSKSTSIWCWNSLSCLSLVSVIQTFFTFYMFVWDHVFVFILQKTKICIIWRHSINLFSLIWRRKLLAINLICLMNVWRKTIYSIKWGIVSQQSNHKRPSRF